MWRGGEPTAERGSDAAWDVSSEKLAEILVARLRARQRAARILAGSVVLDEEVLHPRLARVGEDRLEVDGALSHRRHPLLGAGDRHVLEVPHGEAAGILREQRERILIGELRPVHI